MTLSRAGIGISSETLTGKRLTGGPNWVSGRESRDVALGNVLKYIARNCQKPVG